jgi:hypothetical protein
VEDREQAARVVRVAARRMTRGMGTNLLRGVAAERDRGHLHYGRGLLQSNPDTTPGPGQG